MKNKKTLKEKINKGFEIATGIFLTGAATTLIFYSANKYLNNQKFGYYFNENNEISDEYFIENPNYSENIQMQDAFENELVSLNPNNSKLEGWILVKDKDKNGTFAGHPLYTKPDFKSKKLK